MESFFSLNHISLSFDSKNVFEDINASIKNKDKIGLIGDNGVGKSTLLKLIYGQVTADHGFVEKRGKISYFKQDYSEINNLDFTVNEYIIQYENWWEIVDLLENFNFKKVNFQKKICNLSGGEIIQLQLAIALSMPASLILLDEPTNHLDLQSILKLIDILQKITVPMLIVSHNTYLLNQVVNNIWELNNGKLNYFGGNYDEYLLQKGLNEEARQRKYLTLKKKLKRIKKIQAKESIKSNEQTTKLRKKIKSHDRGISRSQKTAFRERADKSLANAKVKYMNIESSLQSEIEAYIPVVNRYMNKFNIDSNESKSKLIEIKNSDLVINSNVLIHDINFSLRGNERVLITGKNGVGKTAFVNAILNNDLSVPISFIKEDLHSVYLSQKHEVLDSNETVLENFMRINPNIPYSEIRRYLGRFLFISDEEINKKAKILSGGEKTKLEMAMILHSKINLLVMDEPTNNLDISSRNIIIQSLKNYSGALILISHDIDFLKNINVTKTLNINKKKLVEIKTLPKDEYMFTQELLSLSS